MRYRLRRVGALVVLIGGIGLSGCVESDGPESAGTGEFDGGIEDGSVEAGPGCDVVAPRACPDPKPTYTADVEPILQERCIGCHSGMPNGPWPLTSYTHVASWFAELQGAMLSCAMPPPDSGVPMETEERETILTWIRCNLPR
jgi:hypothetical protein